MVSDRGARDLCEGLKEGKEVNLGLLDSDKGLVLRLEAEIYVSRL